MRDILQHMRRLNRPLVLISAYFWLHPSRRTTQTSWFQLSLMRPRMTSTRIHSLLIRHFVSRRNIKHTCTNTKISMFACCANVQYLTNLIRVYCKHTQHTHTGWKCFIASRRPWLRTRVSRINTPRLDVFVYSHHSSARRIAQAYTCISIHLFMHSQHVHKEIAYTACCNKFPRMFNMDCSHKKV